jgi:hypothetical protein
VIGCVKLLIAKSDPLGLTATPFSFSPLIPVWDRAVQQVDQTCFLYPNPFRPLVHWDQSISQLHSVVLRSVLSLGLFGVPICHRCLKTDPLFLVLAACVEGTRSPRLFSIFSRASLFASVLSCESLGLINRLNSVARWCDHET